MERSNEFLSTSQSPFGASFFSEKLKPQAVSRLRLTLLSLRDIFPVRGISFEKGALITFF
jgi:hypothetical protein